MVTETFTIRYRQIGSNVVVRSLDRIGGAANKATRGLFLLQRAIFVVGGAGLVAALAQQVDALTQYENRIRLTADSAQEVERVQDALFAAANRSRSAFGSLAEIYTRVALSVKDLGVSSAETVRFTESLAKATIISGASAREANAALIQLGQGLASNRLSGDELRSVLEQLPFVAQVIADELGITRGELRQFGRDGKLTADIVLQAFRNAADEIDRLFENTTPTISQSFEVLGNAALDAIDRFDDLTGASAILANAIIGLSKSLDAIASGVALGLFAALGAVVQLVANRFILLTERSRRYSQVITQGRVGLTATIAGEKARAQAQLESAVASRTAAQADLTRTQTIIANTAAKKANALAEVQATEFQRVGNQARILATGQYANLTIAQNAYSAAVGRYNALAGIESSLKARLVPINAALAGSTDAVTAAQVRLGAATVAANTLFGRLEARLPRVAGALLAVRSAFFGLFGLIAANPLTALFVAIGGGIIVLNRLGDATQEVNNAVNETARIFTKFEDAIRSANGDVEIFRKSFKDISRIQLEFQLQKNIQAAEEALNALRNRTIDVSGVFVQAGKRIQAAFNLEYGSFVQGQVELNKLVVQFNKGELTVEKFKDKLSEVAVALDNETLNNYISSLIEQANKTEEANRATQRTQDLLTALFGDADEAAAALKRLAGGFDSVKGSATAANSAIDFFISQIPALKEAKEQQNLLNRAQEELQKGLAGARAEYGKGIITLDVYRRQVAQIEDGYRRAIGWIDGSTEAQIELNKAIDDYDADSLVTAQTGVNRQLAREAAKRDELVKKVREQNLGTVQETELINRLNAAYERAAEGIRAQAESRGGSNPDFRAEIQNLEREVELLKVSAVERQKLTNIYAIEDSLKRNLTATERAYVEELTDQVRLLQLRDQLLGDSEVANQRLADGQIVLNQALESGTITLERYIDLLRQLKVEAAAAEGTLSGGFRSAIGDAILSAEEFGKALGERVVGFANRAADAIVEFARTGKINLRELFASLFADLARLAAQQLLLQLLGSVLGFPVAGLGIAGQRADGGPVSAGSTYLVGERGPELFTPSSSGRIVSNEQMRTQQTQQSVVQENIIRLQIVNVTGGGDAAQNITTPAGARQVVNIIRENADTVNRVLRG